ncbi:hypothetical protein P171DRAFT_487724 [Karstenula rhodostoma CBS 690.94]|uniref:Uncharacterized protein n=1 Tax=Karstenula rhodostoma CBS 690.94 TaxID=1392251 RepID=A0A9P4UAW7_9PLEO|nr:hypothetical protein P171DRAFT_487724 [Karstenula rhodostoma CBS 690.94]
MAFTHTSLASAIPLDQHRIAAFDNSVESNGDVATLDMITYLFDCEPAAFDGMISIIHTHQIGLAPFQLIQAECDLPEEVTNAKMAAFNTITSGADGIALESSNMIGVVFEGLWNHVAKSRLNKEGQHNDLSNSPKKRVRLFGREDTDERRKKRIRTDENTLVLSKEHAPVSYDQITIAVYNACDQELADPIVLMHARCLMDGAKDMKLILQRNDWCGVFIHKSIVYAKFDKEIRDAWRHLCKAWGIIGLKDIET